MTTIALVAAKDAAGTIGATVRALGRLRGVDDVWVVDDGSTDDTAAQATGAGATVVRLGDNVGKGGALRAGAEATPHATRYLLADADLGETASGLQALLDAAERDLVVGVLPSAGGRGGFGLVTAFARAGIRRACGFVADAPLSGQRLVNGDRFRQLTLADRFGVEVGVTIDVVRGGGRVLEVPVDVDHRHTGRSWSGFAHRAGQGRDVAGALLSRVTTTTQRVTAVVVAGLLVFGLLSGLSAWRSPPSGAALAKAQRVLLFGFDHLALADLERDDLPALQSLRRSGATGALSVRTSDRRSLRGRSGSERPSAFDAYASLGASARVRAAPRLVRARARDDGVEPSAMAAARAQAGRDRAASRPGALGDSLRRAGKTTGMVAGAQLEDGRGGFPTLAALATSDGRIDHVDVSPSLLERVADAPFGLRASTEAFLIATATALRNSDVVLVDPGDTARAVQAGAGRSARERGPAAHGRNSWCSRAARRRARP